MTEDREQWEYCRLEAFTEQMLFSKSKLIFYTPEGEKIETFAGDKSDSEGEKIAMRIAALGNEGWEMLGLMKLAPVIDCFYFKRKRI